ncbi:anhydro-N-acetylmuramic acid kinase [Adhaeribacter pallidiroseus]|uniref:Anhydro-N-acetylmuramic acid kinase n=1 Tax=Adhaeribacter pallidiroseus TaxID=2072847 RepID=A0A369QTF7_9BACT|nr:anhydro-N-acetylmuramic acid kinase [Adhaeribacter pallidiroseus]RDC66477.1 Anhydro-N-acetylmuramic acid kinase [Adhaeribacter pallidiroseus]
MNTYHVIGLMSGTSLDGVDLAYCIFTKKNQNWIYKIYYTATLPYTFFWKQRLNALMAVSAEKFILADHQYGTYLGHAVREFVSKNGITPDFIASHGHTIFHQPSQHIGYQLGNGAYLAAAAQLPVVCDFRTLDMALGGQGAPLVPIGDQLLFGDYDCCLNLGGIANISVPGPTGRIAFDTGACNMLLNALVSQIDLPFDEDGRLARQGKVQIMLLDQLNASDYFNAPHPKSLGKEWVDAHTLQYLLVASCSIPDKLQTACQHIAYHIANSIKKVLPGTASRRVLTTGGGAFNSYLIELIQQDLGNEFTMVVPEPELVSFKEALIFAFLGVLRWRQEPNCLSSVTGAPHDNVGGAIYWGSNTK